MPKLIATSLFILLAGCVAYQPQPASVETNADALLARSLDSAAVHAAIVADDPSATWPPKLWTLSQLRLVALLLNPDLALARADLAAARAAIRASAERPNPTISAGVERKSGSGEVSPWITALVLDLPIETAGKREARIREATALSNEAAASIDQAIWGMRSGVARAVIELARGNELREAREQEAALREEIVAMHARRVEVGETASPDLARARAEQRAAEASVLAEAARMETARDALASAIGVPRANLPANIDLASVTASHDLRDDATLYKLALTARPDVLAALARYEVADATYRLEVRKQYPDVHISPGLGWDQGAFKWTLGAAAELPLFNHHEGAIGQADAERGRAAAQLLAVQARVLSAVDAARTRERTARERLTAMTRTADARKELATSARKQFAAGEIDRLVLRQQEVESAAAETDRVDARFDLAAALVELEAAVEQPLGGNE
jgi:outer membrane protein, heavy metal efflux system